MPNAPTVGNNFHVVIEKLATRRTLPITKMAESGSPVGTSSIRWQIALALGLPVAVGVGYWYLNSKGSGDKLKRLEDKRPNANREISIDGDVPSKVTVEPKKKVTLYIFS